MKVQSLEQSDFGLRVERTNLLPFANLVNCNYILIVHLNHACMSCACIEKLAWIFCSEFEQNM